MTERRIKVATTIVYLGVAVAYLVVVLSVAVPDFRERTNRALEWARYYHWLKTRLPVPGWLGALQREDLPDEVAP